MKKYILFILLAVLTLPAGAVLKEKDLARTLGVLRAELEQNYKQQKANMARMEQMTAAQHQQLVDYMQRSEQIALMLYSQNQDFTFDVAYACQQATDLHRELSKNNLPYAQISARIRAEVERYDGLVEALSELPPAVGAAANTQADSLLVAMVDTTAVDSAKLQQGATRELAAPSTYLLTKQQQTDRDRCLLYAKALRENMKRILNAILADKDYYDVVTARVEKLNSYAQERYRSVQDNIFRNGGDNYLAVLSKLPFTIRRMAMEANNKYGQLENRSANYSQWRGPIIKFISFFIIIYLTLSILFSNLLVRWIVPFLVRRFRRDPSEIWGGLFVGHKKPALLMAFTMLVFAIAVMVVHNIADNHFVVMATSLLATTAWMTLVVFTSLLIRVDDSIIARVGRLYTPFICMSFLVIYFRIILVPNNIVNIAYPPLLLMFTWWQWRVIRHANKVTDRKDRLPSADFFYGFISLAAMVVATGVAFYGYTLMAVEIMMWWMFQLAAIQTITCIYDLLERYEVRFLTRKIRADLNERGEAVAISLIQDKAHRGEYIHVTWFYDLINRALVPVCAVGSILLSIYWAADVFQMTEVCVRAFHYNFINEPEVVQISLHKLCMVIGCYFVFRYINYLVRSLYHYYKLHHSSQADADHNFTLANNVIAILVWGIYFLYALVLLHVPKSGISVVGAGLATGMGFAMKDLLENFFYGISLMTGRLRVGDYIECDGITGKVETITYQSTQLVTADGSLIAFLNSALFSKNFKNLTRSNIYILHKTPVGVAYGTKVEEVRQMLIEAVTPLSYDTADGTPSMDPTKSVNVILSGLGDSSVDLTVATWVLVSERATMGAKIQETVYNTLNANGIEIPFPQRDLHIIQQEEKAS
ncbi:MAG: mechanosensitive ion channel family protein [Bacteroidaceae bacterium]|nr:mechanosensitive ion channel family protein [Bacteroidaceae bacterium]